MAGTYRADYEVLNKIASTFGQQADAIRSMSDKIKSSFDPLQSGKWKGKGAPKFFNEMNSSVLPSCQRLERALSQAASVTKKMAQVAKAAEEQSSGCFHL